MSQYRSRQSKMWLIIFATFCISLSAGRVVDGKYTLVGEYESSLFPDKYTVKATKTTITGNLVEDIVYWKSGSTGRIDQGYFKSIIKNNGKKRSGYEIYPKTDKDENVEYVCIKMKKHAVKKFTLGVPGIADLEYKAIGNETVLGYEATRFEYAFDESDMRYEYTVWAAETSVGNESIWTPLRYEENEYNTLLGALTNHVIWDFYEFSVDFDEDEVYDVEALGCDSLSTVEVTQDSDAVVKELMFINPENKEHVDHVFNSFKSKFNPKYAHEEEHNLRRNIFKRNMRLISSTNRRNLGYKLGVNKFADRTPEEKQTGYRRRSEGVTGNIPFPYTQKALDDLADTLPEEVDLRVEGLVSPVKNQASCGSCWAFATTAAVEGALARVNGGRLMALSSQALIDCTWAYGNDGCKGGYDDTSYKWMMQYGLPTDEEYGPYQNQDGYCHIKNMTTIYPIKGFTQVTRDNKEALKVAVFKHGPLSVSIDATDQFDLYSSGIFYDEDCKPNIKETNHIMTVVGYGVEYGELYWILKNSHGSDWGIEGYMLISAKQDCGVSAEAKYAVF